MKKVLLRFTSSASKILALLAVTCLVTAAQSTSDPTQDLAASVRELRTQVEELRTAVAEIKAEAAQYRNESQQLRTELQSLRSSVAAQSTASNGSTEQQSAASQQQRISSLEETTQVLQSEVRTQYQSKVESASKYRVRLSGLVLLNMFSNRGAVDNMDIPAYAAPSTSYGAQSSFGATLRQSELGLEVFGPQVAGARSSGQVQVDFGGGFPAGALDGVSTGVVRLRTADVRLDWGHTALVGGQDDLFISPVAPTSFASLVVPSLGYSGNLWSWTPQVRVEHKFDLGENSNLMLQAGVLDNVTGDRSSSSLRQPQAGEASGQPAYAVRTSWNSIMKGNPASFGVSGYYSRQNWGGPWTVDGWLVSTDWRVPVSRQFELSGELFRGRAIGGVGGAVGQSVLFTSDPSYPGPKFRALNAAGGWSQLKYIATSRLEFNGAFGLDNPFASDIHAFVSPVGPYQTVIAANRSEMVNFIYRPRSDLLFSGEYRHLRTTQFSSLSTADQVNLTMGVLF